MARICIALFVIQLLTVASEACAFCFREAGELYGINPVVLRSIARQESNLRPDAVNRNKNGSYDVGLMQINTIWKSTLGEERWRHLGDACYNTKTGAWILASCISKYGYNWKAVGCYNSQTPMKRDEYAQRVFKRLERLKDGRDVQPLDKDVETAVMSQIEDHIKESRDQHKPAKKRVIKFVPYTRLAKEKLLRPPEPPAGAPTVPVPVAW